MRPPDREVVVDRCRRHVNRGLALLADLSDMPLEVRAAGTRVVDDRGREYLQCGGYGVFLLGHAHPQVLAAVREQLERMPLSTRSLLSPELADAAATLAAAAPGDLQYAYFGTSGAEATETALKLARLHGCQRIVATEGGYHGKTTGALSVTGRDAYRVPFAPLLPGVEIVPFGSVEAIEAQLAKVGPSCVILEPIQAEGGVRIPPPGYLSAVAAACRAHGALLVLDEIQTGLGRVGAWWAADRESVVPDVLLCGKILSGGLVPVSAVVATEAAWAPLSRDPILHSATFAGAPVAAAAASATIRAIEAEGLVERSLALGEELLPEIARVLHGAAPGLVRDVRGAGLLIGIELPTGADATELAVALLERGVITSYSMNAQAVVRLTPPATLSAEDVDWLLSALDDAGRALAATRTRTPVGAGRRR